MRPTLTQRLLIRPAKRLRDRLRRRIRAWWRRSWPSVVKLGAGGLAFLWLLQTVAAACNAPPENPENLCDIFREKRSWYRAAKRSYEKWGVPEAVQLAVMYQESGFRATVRPPRRKILWIFPGPRPSSAIGFGQVLDGTWRSYQLQTGRPHARRDHFADVAHFIGWYGTEIHRLTGVAKTDAYGLYLAYHEGPGGYRRGTHHAKAWLLRVAERVRARARRYEEQYDGCRERLAKWWIFW